MYEDDENDENAFTSLGDIIDRDLERLRSGKPDLAAQKREMAYRRGYLQGWSDLIDTVFTSLLDKGVSIDQAYKVVARIQNEVIQPWRNSLRITNHAYNVQDFLKEQTNDSDEYQ